jgi:hypothetical protein
MSVRRVTHSSGLLESLVALGLQETHDDKLNGQQGGGGDVIVLGTWGDISRQERAQWGLQSRLVRGGQPGAAGVGKRRAE